MSRLAFAPGFYHRWNKGDVALARSYFRWLTDDMGFSRVISTSFDPDGDRETLGVEVLHMVTRPRHLFHRACDRLTNILPAARPLLTWFRLVYFSVVVRLVRLWAKLYLVSPRVGRLVAPSHVSRVADVILGAEAVFMVPGGYLLAPRPTSDSWLFHVPTIELAAALRRPIFLGPCSFGPFHPRYRRWAIRTLELVDLVVLREDVSRRFVESYIGEIARSGKRSPRVVTSADMAFWYARTGLPRIADPVIDHALGDTQAPMLGVSVRSHYFASSVRPEEAQRAYIDEVAGAIAQLTKSSECAVVLIPQGYEDVAINSDLESSLAARGVPCVNIDAELDVDQLRCVYARLRLLIGTRMHANILAMSVGTPVVAIGYEPKARGILESMELSEWCLDITDLGNGRLESLVTEQWLRASSLRELTLEKAMAQADRITQLSDLIRSQNNGTSVRDRESGRGAA